MKKRLHVAASPLTGTIYAGPVLKDGITWGAGTQDVTGPACAAVAQHAISKGGMIVVRENGIPKYEIRAIQIYGENL